MKFIITCFMILLTVASDNNSFYQFKVTTLEGKSISCSAFKGKKVLITVVDATDPALDQLRYIDSLQQSMINTLRVIVIPTSDFKPGVDLDLLKHVQSRFHILITDPLKVKRQSGQDELFQWLTDSSKNTHFNNDVNGEGQVFLISPQGVLYGVLSSGVPNEVIGRATNQNIKE